MVSYEETTAVALARDVYREDNRPPLPEGVTLYLDCPDEYQKDGYFGAAYYFVDKIYGQTIVIAHRGTANLDGLIEDAEMDFFHKIPSQFYDGAVPFSDYVLENISKDYPGQSMQFTFTGHSLGATLAELSCVRYINQDDNRFLRYRMFTYVFDSPGSKDLVDKQLANKEITEKDVEQAGYSIIVVNAEIDAINTCMKTSSRDDEYNYIRSYMGQGASPYISLSNGSLLPYDPDNEYYFSQYTLKDQHPIANLYDRIMRDDYGWWDISVGGWPIGFHTGYRAYKTYYGHYPPEHNLYDHNYYWFEYTEVYWDQNPQIHDEYDNNLWDFQQYYFKNVCYYYDGYALPKELPYKFNIADMQRIAGILSVEGVLMRFHGSIRHSKKEEKASRICCGISFFPAVDSLHRTVSSTADTVDRVVTEAGEELSRVVSTANSAYQQGQYMFFTEVGMFVNGDEARWAPSFKSQTTFGMKK